jgi:transposase
MSEIERAIQEFEDNAYHTSMKPTISEASKAVALRILRAELSRQENAPMTAKELEEMIDKPIFIVYKSTLGAHIVRKWARRITKEGKGK